MLITTSSLDDSQRGRVFTRPWIRRAESQFPFLKAWHTAAVQHRGHIVEHLEPFDALGVPVVDQASGAADDDALGHGHPSKELMA